VCADGTSLLPGFIFPRKEFHPEWFIDMDERIRQVISMTFYEAHFSILYNSGLIK
jgi:hypothetical protein